MPKKRHNGPSLRIKDRRKFFCRRWEMTRLWYNEEQRRERQQPVDDGLTDEERRAMYAYYEANDMIEPTRRQQFSQLRFESKRRHRIKTIHHEVWHRILFAGKK